MDAIDSGDEYEYTPVSTVILEDISKGSQSHPIVNRRESCYKIHECIKRGQEEWKEALKATRNMGKGLYKVFKTFGK